MKKLNLELDLSKIEFSPNDKKLDAIGLWTNFVINGCRSAYRDGIDLKMQSKLFKVLEKIEKGGGIELEDAEFDILKDIQERGKFDPTFNRIGVQINNAIEEAKK